MTVTFWRGEADTSVEKKRAFESAKRPSVGPNRRQRPISTTTMEARLSAALPSKGPAAEAARAKLDALAGRPGAPFATEEVLLEPATRARGWKGRTIASKPQLMS